MTRKAAIENAVAILSADARNAETVETLNKILVGLHRERKPLTDEQKQANSAKRKAIAAEKRKEMITPIIPILRDALSEPMTAKELYEKVKDNLPADFSWQKVQAILLKEMSPEVTKIECGRNAHQYKRI